MRTASSQLLWQNTWQVTSSSATLVRPLHLTFEAWELGYGSGKPARWQTPKFDVEDVGKTWVASVDTTGSFTRLDWKALIPILLGRRNKPDTEISLSSLGEWTGRPWHPAAAAGTQIDRLEMTLDRLKFRRHPVTRAWLHEIDATLRIYGQGELVVNVTVPHD